MSADRWRKNHSCILLLHLEENQHDSRPIPRYYRTEAAQALPRLSLLLPWARHYAL